MEFKLTFDAQSKGVLRESSIDRFHCNTGYTMDIR